MGVQQFIVSGVGRSGTTAVARALNLHPRVWCAIEHVDHAADHRGLFQEPDALLRAGASATHFQFNRGALDTKRRATLAAIGNKWPQYFLRWQGVLSEMDAPRAIVVVRDLAAVMASWNARLAEGSFPSNYASAYAMIDCPEMVRVACSALPCDTLFVSYRTLLFGERCAEPFARALAHIGAPADIDAAEAFSAQIANNPYVAARQPAELSERNAELASSAPALAAFVAEIDERGACLASESRTASAVVAEARARAATIRKQFWDCLQGASPDAMTGKRKYFRDRLCTPDSLFAAIVGEDSHVHG